MITQLTIVNTFYLLFITYHSLLYFPLVHVHCYAPGRRFRRKYAFFVLLLPRHLTMHYYNSTSSQLPLVYVLQAFLPFIMCCCIWTKNETDVNFRENKISSKWNNYVSVHIFIHYVSCAMPCFFTLYALCSSFPTLRQRP